MSSLVSCLLMTAWLTKSSIPVTLTFEQATGKNVLLLPMGSSTDAAHSINGEFSIPIPSTLQCINMYLT